MADFQDRILVANELGLAPAARAVLSMYCVAREVTAGNLYSSLFFTAGDWFAADCVASQPVGSLWPGFAVCEKLGHFRGLDFQAEVSGRQSSPVLQRLSPLAIFQFPFWCVGDRFEMCQRTVRKTSYSGTSSMRSQNRIRQVQYPSPVQPTNKGGLWQGR